MNPFKEILFRFWLLTGWEAYQTKWMKNFMGASQHKGKTYMGAWMTRNEFGVWKLHSECGIPWNQNHMD